MEDNEITRMTTLFLFAPVLLLAVSIRADQEAGNTLYVRAATYGGHYAKCIPTAIYGDAGETRIYLAQTNADTLEFKFNWYAPELKLQGTAWGISVVRFGSWPRGHEVSTNDLAVAFYLNDKLLKSYSTRDLVARPDDVQKSVSHYTVIKEIKGYRWIKENDWVFDLVTHSGRQLSFDVRTGELVMTVNQGPDFSRHPQTEAFKYFVEWQTNAEWHREQTNLLAITAFDGNDRSAWQYWVNGDGLEGDVLTQYDWAHKALGQKQLSATAMNELRAALGQLPSANATPPIERLAIVSWRQGTNWLTTSYDREALPAGMRKIHELIGDRQAKSGVGK